MSNQPGNAELRASHPFVGTEPAHTYCQRPSDDDPRIRCGRHYSDPIHHGPGIECPWHGACEEPSAKCDSCGRDPLVCKEHSE